MLYFCAMKILQQLKYVGSILLLLLLLFPSAAHALTKEQRIVLPHEIRLGWGDMLFETAMWNQTSTANNHRYTGHIFTEYQYHIKDWLSVGAQIDYEQVLWNTPTATPDNSEQQYFFNLSLLPTVRFTYFFHEYVNLYSALSVGLNINSGTQTDYKGRQTAYAPAFALTLLGVSVGKDHWFGAIEIGALNALNDKQEIYMLGSRLFTISVGYRL